VSKSTGVVEGEMLGDDRPSRIRFWRIPKQFVLKEEGSEVHEPPPRLRPKS
jgi:hypothetical protein